MIKVSRIKGQKFISVITCDMCGERIEDADFAAAVYPTPRQGTEDSLLAAFHVHKGRCHDQVEENLRTAGYKTGWEDLARHMCLALHSVGISSTKLIEMLRFYGHTEP